MGKKLFTLFISIVLIITTFVSPIYGTEEPEPTAEVTLGPGGLDFYSLTIYYDIPTVVDYTYVSKSDSEKQDLIYYYNARGKKTYKEGFVFGEPKTEYVLRAGDTKATAYTHYKDRPTSTVSNFNGIESDGLKNYALYSKFPNNYAYITHIQDNTSILSKQSIFLYGLTRFSDDAGNPNPNYELDENGYFKTIDGIDKIDINGYRLFGENEEWRDNEGNVIVLFKQVTEKVDGVDKTHLEYVERRDESGKIKFLSHADEGLLYRVEDKNGDGVYEESEIKTDDEGRLLRGEPVKGNPVRKNKITRISIEVDALGTQLYSDISQDPQQQNEIILALNDWYEQVLADNHNAPKDKKGKILNPEKIKGIIVGSVKSVTTKTAMNFTDKELVTYKSVDFDLTEEQLNSLPEQADINLTFKIKTHQPDEAFNEDKTTSMVNIWYSKPEYKEIIDETNWALYGAIGGGALVLIVVVIIVIASVGSKKKKAAKVEVADNPPSK